MPPSASFLTYVKKAFTWHWNLLAVGAGAAFGLLSGRPDVVFPLLGAVEIAYLGLLSSNPRFRKAVDASSYQPAPKTNKDEQLRRILSVLSKRDVKRFDDLRNRCSTLHRLGRQFRGLEADGGDSRLQDMHTASLDRLLWMFLKLLYSKDALDRFLRNTDRASLITEINETEKSLAKLNEEGRRVNLIRSLEDKLATVQDRLRNYDAAAENMELIEVELERIEQKVNAVSEMSMSTHDPAVLSSHVDGIAESLSVTAEAVRSLDVMPSLEFDDAPEFLTEEE